MGAAHAIEQRLPSLSSVACEQRKVVEGSPKACPAVCCLHRGHYLVKPAALNTSGRTGRSRSGFLQGCRQSATLQIHPAPLDVRRCRSHHRHITDTVPSLLPLPTLLPCLPELEGAVINKMRMLPLLPRPGCHQQSPIAACIAAAAELEGAGIYKMRMLQKMRLLEEKGATFASTPIKDLPVFGEQLSLQSAFSTVPTRVSCYPYPPSLHSI